MELGYIKVLRKGKLSGPYELDPGAHTIGSSKDSNIRLKFSNPLLLETHAIIRVNENGVATILNKSVEAPVRVNGKEIFKPTILRHEDQFQLLDKEFQYFNEKLKDEPEDSEIFAQELKNVLASSRKSVMPLSSTLAKLPTFKTKVNLAKTSTQRLLNRSLRTPVTKSLNKITRTLDKSLNRTYSNASVRRSIIAGARQPLTPSVIVGGLAKSTSLRTLSTISSRSSESIAQIDKKSLVNREAAKDIKVRSSSANKSSPGGHNTSDVEVKDLNDKPTSLSKTILTDSLIKFSPQNTSQKSVLCQTQLDRKSLLDSETTPDIKMSPPLQFSGIHEHDSMLSNISSSEDDYEALDVEANAPEPIDIRLTNSPQTASKPKRTSRVSRLSHCSAKQELLNLTDSEKSYRLSRASNKSNTTENMVDSLNVSINCTRYYSRRSTAVLGSKNSPLSQTDTIPFINENLENSLNSSTHPSARNSSRRSTAVIDVNNSSLSESDTENVDDRNRSAINTSARNYSSQSSAVMNANDSSLSESDAANIDDLKNKSVRSTSARNSSRRSTAVIDVNNSSLSENDTENVDDKNKSAINTSARNYSRQRDAIMDANKSSLSESDAENIDDLKNKSVRNTSARNSSRRSSALIRPSNLSLSESDNREITTNNLENSSNASTDSSRNYSRRSTAVMDANNSSLSESDIADVNNENKSARNISARNSSRRSNVIFDKNDSSLSESDIADIDDIENKPARDASARNSSRRSNALALAGDLLLSECDNKDITTKNVENSFNASTRSARNSRRSTAVIGPSNLSLSKSENQSIPSKELDNSVNVSTHSVRNYSRKSTANNANESTLSESDIASIDDIENKPARNTLARKSSRRSSALVRVSNSSLSETDNKNKASKNLKNILKASTPSTRNFSKRSTAVIDANYSTLSESDSANIDNIGNNKSARNSSAQRSFKRTTTIISTSNSSLSESDNRNASSRSARKYSEQSTAVVDVNNSSLSDSTDNYDIEYESAKNTSEDEKITGVSTANGNLSESALEGKTTLSAKPRSSISSINAYKSDYSLNHPRTSRRSSRTTYTFNESITKKISFVGDSDTDKIVLLGSAFSEDEAIAVNTLDKSRSSARRSAMLQPHHKEESSKNDATYTANSNCKTDSSQLAESSRRVSRAKSWIQDKSTDEENSSSQISLRLSSSPFESNKPSTSQACSLSEDEIPATQAFDESDGVFHCEDDSSCNDSLISEQKASPKKMPKNVSIASVDSDVQGCSMKSSDSSRRLSRKKDRSSVFGKVNNISALSKGTSIITLYSDSASSLEDSKEVVDAYNKHAASDGYGMRKSSQNVSRRSFKMEQSSYLSDIDPNSQSQTSTLRNSKENTTDSRLNDRKRLNASRIKSTKRISGTFDESTQDNNIYGFKNESGQRKSFDESTKEALPDASDRCDDTEQVLSPVKPLSRKSMQYSRDNTSENLTIRKSVRKSLQKQVSGNSSLTMTSLEQSTGSAYSISSQSFSSFKKVPSPTHDKHDDTEIDVVNYTPAPKERPMSLTYTTVQMFDDVSCTSTPLHKPHVSKRSHEFDGTGGVKNVTGRDKINSRTGKSLDQSEVMLSSSANVTLKATKLDKSRSASYSVVEGVDVPKRRSIRSNISRNGKHDCISCRFSSVKRSRSLSASREVSTANKKLHISPAKTVSPVKRQSSVSASNAGTPILHRKSDIISVCENTPDKSSNTEDETPKSHIKPTRRSSKANQSAYNPVLEDITPVTPERLEVTGHTEEAFKTPINTPGLFESIRKSAIRSRKRHRESNGSALKDTKRARVDFSHREEKPEVSVEETVSRREKRAQKSPLNRLSNFEGVKKLMKTPPKSPKNDLTNIHNLRRIMSPRPQKSPKNDLTAPVGVKRLLRTPKKQNQPANDLSDVSGVAHIFNVSGVEVLHQGSDIENSEDLFTQLTGKRPMRAYPRGKSLSPNKADFQKHYGGSRKTMGDLPICSPRVQQWVEEHATYDVEDKDQPSFVNHDENIFENLSKNPKHKARAGRSVSAKKVALKKTNRRKSQGDVLRSAANTNEWKPHRDTNERRKSGANHSVSPNKLDIQKIAEGNLLLDNEGDKLASLTDKEPTQPRERSKSWRSASPKNATSVERHANLDSQSYSENASSTQIGDNVSMSQASYNTSTRPNILTEKSRDDFDSSIDLAIEEDVSNQLRRESQRGRRGSLRRSIQTKTSRDETLHNTSNVSSGICELDVDSSLLRSIPKEPRRKSRRGRSVSLINTHHTDMRRRKTHGDFLQATPDVINWSKSAVSSKKESKNDNQRQIQGDTFRATPNVDQSSQNTLEVANEDEVAFDRTSRKSRINRSVSSRKSIIQFDPSESQNNSQDVDKKQLLEEDHKVEDPNVSLKRISQIGRSMSLRLSAVGNTSHKDCLLTPNAAFRPEQVKTRNSSILYLPDTGMESSTPNQTIQKVEPITPQETLSFLKTNTPGSARAKKSSESLTPRQKIKQSKIEILSPFATDAGSVVAGPSNVEQCVDFQEQIEYNCEGSLTKKIPKPGDTAERIIENKPLEALRRGARGRRLLSAEDVDIVTGPSVKSPIKTPKLDKHAIEEATIENAEEPSPTINQKKNRTRKGKAEPEGEQELSSKTARVKKTNRGKANKDVPTPEITDELEAKEKAPTKSRTRRAHKVSENDVEIEKHPKGELVSAEDKPDTDVAGNVKTILKANRRGRTKQVDIEETKIPVTHIDEKYITEERLKIPEAINEPVNANKATRGRTRRNNNNTEEMALSVPEVLHNVDGPLVRGRRGKKQNDLHIAEKVETTDNEAETLESDVEIPSKTRSGRGPIASSPARRGGRRGKGCQDELPDEAKLETIDTNEVLEMAAKTRGRRGQIATDSKRTPSSPVRRGGRRGKELAQEDVEAADTQTPDNLDTDKVTHEVEVTSKTKRGIEQPTAESKQTPLSPSRKGGRRGKKNVGQKAEVIDKEHKSDNLDIGEISRKIEIPAETRTRRGKKAIDSQQSPSSPVKRLGRRGKGLDDNVENTDNETTEKLNTDDVSHNSDIPLNTRRRGELATSSKLVPSSPVRKAGRRGKKNQEVLPVEKQVEATDIEETENVIIAEVPRDTEISSNTRTRRGQLAIDSKRTQSSPAKRGGQRGKGLVEENVEALVNQGTENLLINEVSDNVEIPSKTRGKRGQLAAGSKQAPSSPVRKGVRIGKQDQDKLLVEEKEEAANTENEVESVAPKSRSRRGHRLSGGDLVNGTETAKKATRGNLKEVDDVAPSENVTSPLNVIGGRSTKKDEGKQATRSRKVKNTSEVSQPSEEKDAPKTTRGRGRKNVKQLEPDETDEKKSTNSRSKKDAELSKKNDQLEDTAESDFDEDIEFNAPARRRKKVVNSKSDKDVEKTAPISRKTRRGAAIATEANLTEMVEEVPEKATTRGKSKKLQAESIISKPKNKVVEDILEIDIDSPRTARMKRGINKKYSMDEYEIPATGERNKRKVHFEVDKEADARPEVTAKRTRRARK